ncbi:glycosyltransferase [Empedobacter sp. UBA7248]|uniref:glycosyltransferase n=1 Tax=Empedobacter sp. UBA7248 TaxID=1946448 RepID=UPI0025C0FAFB|nr:glycosyltransferase [Empedobacter sp. UBA7248]
MKILYLTNESYYNSPIIDSQVISLLDEICKKDNNVNVTVITFDQEAKEIYFNKNFKLKLIKNRGHVLNLIFSIFYPLFAKKMDIIHVRSYPSMFGAIVTKLIKGTKIIFDPRGLYADELKYKKKDTFYRVFKFSEKLFCKLSDAIIVVSKPFEKYFITKYSISKTKVNIISTFPQANNTKDNIDSYNIKKQYFNSENVKIFVYSGSFEKWQLVDKVFDFFALVEKLIPNSRFAIFSKDVNEFENLINNRRLNRNNFFVKSLSKTEMLYYLSQCDYGILFRDDDIINLVSAPIKFKEYLNSGLTMIMTNSIGDSSEFISINNIGYTIENTEKEDFLAVIEKIKQKGVVDKLIIKTISANNFNINISTNETYKIYKKLMDEY